MDPVSSIAEVLPAAVCERLCDQLSRAGSFEEALAHVDAAREAVLGRGLLTINLNATTADDPPGELQLQRLWSSDAASYPVAGRKRKTMTPWTQQLLVRAEVFVGEGPAALAEVFDDHALIARLDMRAIVNVPLLEKGRCVATFNALGARPHWRPQEVALLRLLALLATPWVLEARHGMGLRAPA